MSNSPAVLLDGPTEGLAPIMVGRIREVLDAFKGAGQSILLVARAVAERYLGVGEATTIRAYGLTREVSQWDAWINESRL